MNNIDDDNEDNEDEAIGVADILIRFTLNRTYTDTIYTVFFSFSSLLSRYISIFAWDISIFCSSRRRQANAYTRTVTIKTKTGPSILCI